MSIPPRSLPILVLALAGGLVAAPACESTRNTDRGQTPTTAQPLPPLALPSPTDAAPLDVPGLHNLVAFAPGVISGSVPEGDEGFRSLERMGIRTIISVDGSIPDVDRAGALGIRYIHLPIGYHGFDDQRRLQLARATRDALARGPVYIHCHHGKHRSAAAAAAALATLGKAEPEAMVARMKVSGTAPNYTGLYRCAMDADALPAAKIDAVPADFPSVWTPSDFVSAMVEIDAAHDHLRAIERAGWRTPPNHPDLVPVAEAGRLADLYRLLAEDPHAKGRPEDFVALMRAARDASSALEEALLSPVPDRGALSERLRFITANCKQCHVSYRD